MNGTADEGKMALLAPMSIKQLVAAGAIGVMIGLIVWGLGYVVDAYILKVLFCGDQAGVCNETVPYALGLASLVGAGLGLFGLIKLRILRPLLVVLAATAALWGLPNLVATLPWLGVAVACALLYSGVYALFAWIARVRSLWVVVVIFTGIVIAIRLALVL